MADHQQNHQHHYDGDRKSEQNIANLDNTTEVKTITDICYDCLEYIFNFLDFESLLNAANTCKQLQSAAAIKFEQDFGKKWCISLNLGRRISYVLPDPYCKEVAGFKSGFAVLRCFGAKISNLTVQFPVNLELQNDLHIIQYINHYCTNNLTKIRFEFKQQPFPMENFPKPLNSVEKCEILDCNLEDQLPNISNRFPNLRHLRLSFVSVVRATTRVHFPQLEKLIIIDVNDWDHNFSFKSVVDLLHSNPQLTKLTLRCNGIIKPKTIFHVISRSQSILEFEFELFAVDTIINMTEIIQFINDHPQIIKLSLTNCKFKASDAIFLMSQLPSLKYFRFKLLDLVESNRFESQMDNNWQHEVLHIRVSKLTSFISATMKRL